LGGYGIIDPFAVAMVRKPMLLLQQVVRLLLRLPLLLSRLIDKHDGLLLGDLIVCVSVMGWVLLMLGKRGSGKEIHVVLFWLISPGAVLT